MKGKSSTKSIEAPEEQKRFLEYKHSQPFQLSLFDLFENEKDFSHTIELYDFMPKFVWGKVERVAGVFLHSIEREFECRGKKYLLTITPASIKEGKGKEKYYYPAKREEIVEDALRKIMAEGHGVFLDGEAGVSFTLYRLLKELQDNGHTYNRQQIKDALNVLARTTLELRSESGSIEFTFHPIEAIGFSAYAEFNSFDVMQQKAVLEMSASRFTRIKETMNFDIILPITSVCFGGDLRVLERFHLVYSLRQLL
jgi:hypothetical protein